MCMEVMSDAEQGADLDKAGGLDPLWFRYRPHFDSKPGPDDS